MHKADKKMFETYLTNVDRGVRDLFGVAGTLKDRELSRTLENIASDINYVTKDMRDTLSRL